MEGSWGVGGGGGGVHGRSPGLPDYHILYWIIIGLCLTEGGAVEATGHCYREPVTAH